MALPHIQVALKSIGKPHPIIKLMTTVKYILLIKNNCDKKYLSVNTD